MIRRIIPTPRVILRSPDKSGSDVRIASDKITIKIKGVIDVYV